jgi:hypothetical protein
LCELGKRVHGPDFRLFLKFDVPDAKLIK